MARAASVPYDWLDMDAAVVVEFPIRLRERREALGPHATQAWLSDRSGVDRSLISRLERGEREPTVDTLQYLAPVLGVDVEALVAGTDAETRLRNAADVVPREHLMGAVAKMGAYEGTISDLQARNRSQAEALGHEQKARRTAEQAASDARAEADRDGAKLRELQERFAAQGEELQQQRTLLAQAMADFSGLQSHMEALKRELAATKSTAKAASIVAAMGAAASFATLAKLVSGESTATASAPRAAKGTKK
jgi:transcriptional regulator with XRE-family HTH domain